MSEKIYLGKVKDSYKPECFINNEKLYLEKHSWDCGWYWGFGYIGNKNLHTHYDIMMHDFEFKNIWQETPFTDNQWYVINDLFIQAYALKKAADVYKHGGYITNLKGTTDKIINIDMYNKINKDLEIILNTLWDYMYNIINNKNK
jgi:hypothetical protein